MNISVGTQSRNTRNLFPWPLFAQYFSLILAFYYIFAMPSGILGFYIALASLVISLLAANSITLVVYFLLFGMKTLGFFCLVFGYPGYGGKIVLLVAIIMILLTSNPLKLVNQLRPGLLWLAWLGLILCFFYFLGPQTPYCKTKLLRFIAQAFIMVVGFSYLFNRPSVDWWHLGQLGILSAVAFLAIGIAFDPILKPSNFLDFFHIRMVRKEAITPVSIITLSYLAMTGLIIMVSADAHKVISRFKFVALILYCFLTVILLGWSGSRLYIVALIISFVSVFLTKPKYKMRYVFLSILAIAAVTTITVLSLSRGIEYVASVMDPEKLLIVRLNRSTNWIAALGLIKENPYWGHGLGGYFIYGYSDPGGGTYAHNVFLELLSETGIVGTMLILGSMFFLRNLRKKISATMQTQSGQIILPLFFIVFLQVMIRSDIATSSMIFAMIAALITRKDKGFRYVLRNNRNCIYAR